MDAPTPSGTLPPQPHGAFHFDVSLNNLKAHMRTFRFREHSVRATQAYNHLVEPAEAWAEEAMRLRTVVNEAFENIKMELENNPDPRLHNAWHSERYLKGLRSERISLVHGQLKSMLDVMQHRYFYQIAPVGEMMPDQLVRNYELGIGVMGQPLARAIEPLAEYTQMLRDEAEFNVRNNPTRGGYDSGYDTAEVEEAV